MLRYYLFAAFIQVVWSLTPSASQAIIRELPLTSYAALRYTVSGLLFLLLARPTWRRLSPGEWQQLILLGTLVYGVAGLGFLHGLRLGGVVTFSLAHMLNGVILAGLALWLLKEKANRYFPLAVGLSLLGGALLVHGKHGLSGTGIAIGAVGLVWGACALEGLGFIFSKRARARMSLLQYLAILQLSGGVFLWLTSAASGTAFPPLHQLSGQGWLALAFVIVVACFFCFLAQYWLLGRVEGHRLAFFDGAHSVSAAAWGFILFHEPFNSTMAVGGLLLCLSAVVVPLGHPVRKSIGEAAELADAA